MPRFACPHCETVLRANDSAQGSTVVCPRCKKRIKVHDREPPPEADEPEEEERVTSRRPVGRQPLRDDEDDYEEERPRRRPMRKRAKSGGIATHWILIGVLGGALVFGTCCGLGGWMLFKFNRAMDEFGPGAMADQPDVVV